MRYCLILILALPLWASDPIVEPKQPTPVIGLELSEHRKATAEMAILMVRFNALKLQILAAQYADSERIKVLQQSHGAGDAELTIDGQWIGIEKPHTLP